MITGAVADVTTFTRTSADVAGSFREVVVYLQDDVPINQSGRSSGGAMNMRAEPLDTRGRDPTLWFSDQRGPPETPVLEANAGDPLVFRVLVGATNDVHTFHLDGHRFRAEPYDARSPLVDTVHVGISERYDLSVRTAGGARARPGAYRFLDGRSSKLREGVWGVLRVHGPGEGGLRPLAGHEEVPTTAPVCPPGAADRSFRATARSVGEGRKAFVADGAPPGVPFVLRANAGECVRVALHNETDAPVTFDAGMLIGEPGVAAGSEPVRAVPPGESRTFTYFADAEVTALVRDEAGGAADGLYGAIAVGPVGARYRNPATGSDGSLAAVADVLTRRRPARRDAVLLLEDEDAGIGTHHMPYSGAVEGVVAINQRAAPLSARATDPALAFTKPDPPTPVIRAVAGDLLRLHVIGASSEQSHVFSLDGHRWRSSSVAGADESSSIAIGAWEVVSIFVVAGGRPGLAARYVFGDHREPYREAGMWGVLRVGCSPGEAGVLALAGGRSSCPRSRVGMIAAASGVVFLLGAALLRPRSRRRRKQGRTRTRAAQASGA